MATAIYAKGEFIIIVLPRQVRCLSHWCRAAEGVRRIPSSLIFPDLIHMPIH
jgi:hypothetical protein